LFALASHDRAVCNILAAMTGFNELKGFGCFTEATKKQKEFAGKLGLNLEGIPRNVATAMVETVLKKEFYGKKVNPSTQKQIDFGKKFNWDFTGMPSRIAYAYISNILWELNFVTIEQQQLESGVWTENIFNGEKRQISSINKKGIVKFADNRPHSSRYARSLLRCAPPSDGKPFFPGSQVTNHLAKQTHEQLLSKLVDCILLAEDE